METFLEILKYTIPAIIVFLASYLTLWKMIQNDQRRRKMEILLNNQKIVTPLKLQAYERLILLLERLSPDALIMRSTKPNISTKQLHASLLSTIRLEFDHNISQQIYVSAKAWGIVKGAKENLIKIINNIAKKAKPNQPGILLSKEIIEKFMELEKPPTQIAIDYLKKEAQSLL